MASNPHHVGVTDAVKHKKGETTWTIYPKGLSIVWGNDKRYWKIPEDPKSTDPAELLQVSWLEVTCSITDDVKANKEYKVEFWLQLTPDAFGWSGRPVFIMTKRKDSKPNWKRVTVHDKGEAEFTIDVKSPASNTSGGSDSLYFGLYEVWGGKWKGGLKILRARVTEI